MKPLILISNDDGYQSKGLNELVRMVADYGDIIVCAPDGGRSGKSCSFSMEALTLRLQKTEGNVQTWVCSGTPVDCVKMAYSQVCPRKPALVLSGINHGDNASTNAHYSGTMGVTMEGCLKFIPSVAYSLCDHRDDADFEPLRPYIRRFTEKVLREGLPKGICLNINFPLIEERDYRGVKVCRMAFGTWFNETIQCHHPRGYDYWWMVGHYRNEEPENEDTDNWALQHGYVAITPTHMDVTAYEFMAQKDDWEQ